VPAHVRPVRDIVAALALVAAGAAAAGAQPPLEYRGTGVVVALMSPPSSLHATRPVVILQHQPIPGLMEEEMSMPFIAASVDLFRDVKPGDRVAFVLRDTPGALVVVSLQRMGRP
jgi:Cu/Ag efflux protein CusF